LKAYGARYHQDPARWSFLTGKTDPLLLAVTEAYKQAPPVKALPQNATGFLALHGEAFVLLDGEGRVRGYGGKSDSGLDGLISSAIKLRAESATGPARN
jgi:protein SCO1/2